MSGGDGPREEEGLPFPDSLCHSCAAPPKYIRTERSTFLFCPIFRKYPPQPVRECPKFRPREEAQDVHDEVAPKKVATKAPAPKKSS